METAKTIVELLKDVMKLRRYLQEYRALTPEEEAALKIELEMLLHDLDLNAKRRRTTN